MGFVILGIGDIMLRAWADGTSRVGHSGTYQEICNNIYSSESPRAKTPPAMQSPAAILAQGMAGGEAWERISHPPHPQPEILH